jgi:hypothetical protein
MVARKRKADGGILRLLAEDPSDAVRSAVARHQATPRDVLRRMAANDPWLALRELATERLHVT